MLYRYSQWDGSQLDQALDVDELLQQLSEEVLQHGDLERALRQLMHHGMRSPSYGNLPGIQELIQRLRSRRQELLSQHNLDGLQQTLERRLGDILERERETLQQRLQAPAEGLPEDMRSLGELRRRMARHNLEALDALPPRLPERLERLQQYDFLDPDAARDFQDLINELRSSVLESFFEQMSRRLQDMTPEDLQRLRDMTRALNELFAERLDGAEPDFDGFMRQFGDIFGPNAPRSFDELLERMQRSAAQMQSLLNSLSDEQREWLLDTLSSRIFDGEMQHELSELAAHLEALSPDGVNGSAYAFFGDDELTLQQALRLMEQLRSMEEVERQLGRVRFGGSLDDVEPERMRQALGGEAAEQLEELKSLSRRLEEAGYLRRRGSGLELTAHAMRKIGQKALHDIFDGLQGRDFGSHAADRRAAGLETSEETKQYEFGDAFHLDLQKTLRNALCRGERGVPVKLTVNDFEVLHPEQTVTTSTVLVLDVSRSMPMRGNFVAAKKVAMALNTLIRTQYPRDTLYVVGFSGVAREIEKDRVAQLNVGDFGRGTNVQAGLRVARRLLQKHRGSRCQVVLITDGEPTAYFERDGRLAIEYPPGPRVLRETLREVARCTREGIVINTFMLERSYQLRSFVTQLARANHGRVLFAAPESLGRYILHDYVGGKTRTRRR